MPKMSSTDATIHSVKDLIIALQNTAPAIPLVTVINLHKEALIYLSNIFGKAAPQQHIKGYQSRRHTKRNFNR